jgi:hypothetical protein
MEMNTSDNAIETAKAISEMLVDINRCPVPSDAVLLQHAADLLAQLAVMTERPRVEQ